MRAYILPIMLVLALFLAACSPQTAPSVATSTPTLAPTQTSTILPSPTSTNAPQPTATPEPVSPICTPLEGHELARITEYISHAYRDPVGSNLETGHHGVDFSYYAKDGSGPPIDGTPVQTIFDGRVAGLGINRLPYGNMLVIETPGENLPAWVVQLFELGSGDSLYILYAHMLAFPTHSIGQQVFCGENLGQVGNSGFSGNPHLHIETRVGPSGIDLPTMIFYETTATLEEQAAYTAWRTGEQFIKFDPTSFLIQAGAQ